MIPKQDRQGVRQAREIEQKYDLNKDFSSIEKLAASASQTALNAQSAANNAATRAEEAHDRITELSRVTGQQFEAVGKQISNLSDGVSGLDKRVEALEENPGGATFTPSVDADGNLSWTNDMGLENPATVNIKGAKGDKGDSYTLTDDDKAEIANSVLQALPTYNGEVEDV